MSNPKSIYHGLSVLTGADASQRLAHPLDEVVRILRQDHPRTVIGFFNDALTRIGYHAARRLGHPAGHNGIDYLCGNNNKVKAMYSGVVVQISDSDDLPSPPLIRKYKNVTIWSYTNWHPGGGISRWGFEHRYAHLKDIDPAIQVGVPVKKGQGFARSGRTGTWITHLHVDLKAFERGGAVGNEDCPTETKLTDDLLIAAAERINGYMNFVCFLPADEAPAIASSQVIP